MLSNTLKIALLLCASLGLQACTTCDIARLLGNDICDIASIQQSSVTRL